MTDDAPLYERDPAAWQAYLAEGNATQPRKRVGADVLIRDQQGRILLVDPKYKPGWDLPGGMSEANEPPAETAHRELKEELGLNLHPGQLLCLDWVEPHGPWDDSLMLIFDGGTLPPGQIAELKLTDDELRTYELCTIEAAQARLRSYVWRRVAEALQALENGRPRYLHNGRSPL